MEPVRILYRDEAMAVCVKPQGAASQADGAGSMPALLEAALGVEQVWPVHRLDQAAQTQRSRAQWARTELEQLTLKS